MKHAPNTPSVTNLPAMAPQGLTAGLDWAKDDHVICVVDSTGAVRDRFSIEHTGVGLEQLVRRLAKLGCVEIAIERPDGPVVDALLGTDLTVVVISPNLVGLTGKAGARVKTLSGGQQRRLDVALGIVGRPELVFLDEPTTGFDPTARHGAWDLLDSGLARAPARPGRHVRPRGGSGT